MQYIAFIHGISHSSQNAIPFIQRYAELTNKRQILVEDDFEACLRSFPSAKLLILTLDTDALIAAASTRLPPNACNMFRGSPRPYFVEFLAPNTSKGEGLRRICVEEGISLSESIAFGDGENDKVSKQLFTLSLT